MHRLANGAQHMHLSHFSQRDAAARRPRGFTLVELLIAVAAIAILASVAYPSYQRQVMQSRRAKAQVCLSELVQFMERFYTTNMRYDQTAAGVAVALPATTCAADLATQYNFAFSAPPTATTYAVSANAIGAQTKDTGCTVLTVNNTGQKTPAAGCWK
jgi:type IV pilus assembly protein PilE